jgi:hypothetical protein
MTEDAAAMCVFTVLLGALSGVVFALWILVG